MTERYRVNDRAAPGRRKRDAFDAVAPTAGMAKATETYGDWPLERLMTEVVGSGHKSADDMDREQAAEAFRRIIDGEPDRTTLGAFWLANRWKRNTPEELGAFVDVMSEGVETAEIGRASCRERV